MIINEIKKELLKRVMILQLYYTEGSNYSDKLEKAYKTNLVIILFLVTIIIGVSTRLIDNIWYTQDVIHSYRSLDDSNGKYVNIIDNMILTNKAIQDDIKICKREKHELKTDLIVLSRKIKELNEEEKSCKK